MISKVVYSGSLRTEATHLASNQKIITDAPIDNHGKGEAFSPTDLLAETIKKQIPIRRENLKKILFVGFKSGNGEEIQPNLQTTCNIPPS